MSTRVCQVMTRSGHTWLVLTASTVVVRFFAKWLDVKLYVGVTWQLTESVCLAMIGRNMPVARDIDKNDTGTSQLRVRAAAWIPMFLLSKAAASAGSDRSSLTRVLHWLVRPSADDDTCSPLIFGPQSSVFEVTYVECHCVQACPRTPGAQEERERDCIRR